MFEVLGAFAQDSRLAGDLGIAGVSDYDGQILQRLFVARLVQIDNGTDQFVGTTATGGALQDMADWSRRIKRDKRDLWP